MIVENTQEIHQAFEAIMENTEFSRHTKETLTKRIMELYGPYQKKSDFFKTFPIKIVKNLHKIPPSVAFLTKLKAVLAHNFYHYA